jgi:hypothetical protein
VRQAQRFLGAHAAVSNLFNLGRHLVRAQRYCDLRVTERMPSLGWVGFWDSGSKPKICNGFWEPNSEPLPSWADQVTI